MTAPKKPKPLAKSELAPVPWHRIEVHYKAGIRSINAISKEFGVTRRAIDKHAEKHGWTRDLGPAIHEKANRLVDKAVATPKQKTGSTPSVAGSTPATAKPVPLTDAQIVEAGAEALSLVKLGHRKDIAALREIIGCLMDELATTMRRPDLFAQVQMVLTLTPEDEQGNPIEGGHIQAVVDLEDAMRLVASLPARTKVAKDLADALHKCIGMEREAFGLDTNGGTDGMPLVLIRDFTGKNDPDSPFHGQPTPESEF